MGGIRSDYSDLGPYGSRIDGLIVPEPVAWFEYVFLAYSLPGLVTIASVLSGRLYEISASMWFGVAWLLGDKPIPYIFIVVPIAIGIICGLKVFYELIYTRASIGVLPEEGLKKTDVLR